MYTKITNRFSVLSLLVLALLLTSCQHKEDKEENWTTLFNGKNLSGWKASENKGTFFVENGCIVAQGDRSHLFYTGESENIMFTNFELSLDVMTHHLANSGVFIHTTYQEEGWPEQGYEIQINNSHIGAGDYREYKKTGSIYSIRNIYKAMAKDSTWFHLHITVKDKHVKVTVNDIVTADYEEPTHPIRFGSNGQPRLGSGTIALQGHDPQSRVLFKNIKIKSLPESLQKQTEEEPTDASFKKIMQLQSQQFTFTDLDRTITDSLPIDSTISSIYSSGINLGMVTDLKMYEVNSSDVTLINNLTLFADYPVFMGIKIHSPKELDSIKPDFAKQFDYIIGEIDLPDTHSAKDFAKAYTHASQELLKSKVNIWGDPLAVPDFLQNQSGTIWTNEVMLSLILAAKENNVAIEINNALKIPSLEFISLAKKHGCKFVCGNVTTTNGVANIDYFIQAIKYAQLNYKDIFVPDKGVIE